MIQILGLREQNGETKTYFFNKKWRAPSIEDLFRNLDKYVEQIPEQERYNMHFTLANCKESERARQFEFQGVIGIDIDNMIPEHKDKVIEIVLDTLNLDFAKTGISFSGHGLHFFIKLDKTIEDKNYFKTHKIFYDDICHQVDIALLKNWFVRKL